MSRSEVMFIIGCIWVAATALIVAVEGLTPWTIAAFVGIIVFGAVVGFVAEEEGRKR